MKKILAMLLVGLIAISMIGCNDPVSTIQWTTDQDGNRVMIEEGRLTTFPQNLPVDITYNTEDISVVSVDVYQDLLSDYSYCLYLVVKLDVSNLDEAQIHWLRKSDINVAAYLTSDDNGYDFYSMGKLGNLLDDLNEDEKVIYYTFTSSFLKENRYSFVGSEITVSVDIKQEETYTFTYEDKSVDRNKECGIHYTLNLDQDLPESEEIPYLLYNYMVEWLKK